MVLPVMKVDLGLGEGILPFIEEIQSSGIYGNFGPQVMQLEAEYAELLGLPKSRLVSASNATIGLQGALAVFEMDSWVVPSWSFAATAHAARLQDSELYFGDVLRESWVLDPNEVRSGEGAVVTAPFGAQIAIGAEWNHVGGLVIDAAAAIGAFPEVGESFCKPWAIVVSLHATKVLGIGEGGFVVFSSDELAQKFRQWTNFGFSGNREAPYPSTNGKLSEVSAAIGRFRLSGWTKEKSDWLEARRSAHGVGSELEINVGFSRGDWVSPYWVVDFSQEEHCRFAEKELHEAGIEFRSWWSSGCHRMPAFVGIPSRGSLEVTEEIAAKSLGLPFFRGINADQVEQVSLSPHRAIRQS